MLRFCSLYSGSTGNSLLVQNDDTNILIDAGVSGKKITEALTSLNININNISAILVTHEHSDHIKSIGTISKKYNIPVFANKETWNAMENEKNKITEDNQKIFEPYKYFYINSLKIGAFKLPHDAANPCGFCIISDNKKISIATDLGHVTPNIMNCLQNSSFVLLESNYDPEVLRCSRYPYSLKTRIDGPNGHLSNYTSGKIVSTLISSGLKSAMLGHLSKENNFPELAYKTVVEELYKKNFNENSIELNVASRNEPSKMIEVS